MSDDRFSGPISDICSHVDCENESAYQVGFTVRGALDPKSPAAEAWTGVTECEEHHGFVTAELLVPEGGGNWRNIGDMFASVGRAKPIYSTLTMRRRGL